MSSPVDQARAHIQRATGYSIEDEGLILQALDTTGMRTPQSNRRLALLGDLLLRAVIVDDWSPPARPPIAGNTNLARAGRASGLGPHITTHPGHRGSVSNKTLATTVEAILGAIFLDSIKDLSAVKDAMRQLGLMD